MPIVVLRRVPPHAPAVRHLKACDPVIARGIRRASASRLQLTRLRIRASAPRAIRQVVCGVVITSGTGDAEIAVGLEPCGAGDGVPAP